MLDEWLNATTFPLYPELPWWGLFGSGLVIGFILPFMLKGKKKKKKG